MTKADANLDLCGCCEGTEPLTPASVENLPGLSALAYRVGTHGQFKETMLAALAGQSALRSLTTRDDDDPAIALIDAWATVLDVLAFYQERIANEGYLRTADERMSVLEMARSIGYELRPGVAASTYLAFSMETAPGAPTTAKIPVGTQAQSLPGQDETPQLFETIEEIEARTAWQDLKPKQTKTFKPEAGRTQVYLEGAALNLSPGDPLLFIDKDNITNWDLRRVKTATPERSDDYTLVTLDQPIYAALGQPNTPEVYALRRRAALFGHNAPDWRTMPDSVKKEYVPALRPVDDLTEQGLVGAYFEDKDLINRKLTSVDDTVEFDWGSGSPDLLINANEFSVRWSGWVEPPTTGTYTFYTHAQDGVRLWVNDQLIINDWTDVQQPIERNGTISLEEGRRYPIKLEYFVDTGLSIIELKWEGPSVPKDIIPNSQLHLVPDEWPGFTLTEIADAQPDTVHLDAVYDEIMPESWVVLSAAGVNELYEVQSTVEDSRANFTLTAKTSRLTLTGQGLKATFDHKVRETVVFGESEKLTIAEKPDTSTVGGNAVVLATKVEGLSEGQFVAITETDTKTGKIKTSEVATLAAIDNSGATTTKLTFVARSQNGTFLPALEHTYTRSSVVLNANVAPVTHGETEKDDVLGSGDGSKMFQKFTLSKKPLTYVSASTPSGGKTTLTVRVDGVLWEEVSSLYKLAADRRAYITRLADDGTVTVQFGDGLQGRRLPTGSENVKATYRVGLGLDGLVDDGQISLLKTRPLGVKGVINPTAPSGAADPEKLADARTNAPLTVLTLDRIVSVQDFEDFARAFSGIGKAQATVLWSGERQVVHLTIAGVKGAAVSKESATFGDLKRAIDAARHPDQPVEIDPYDPNDPPPFTVEAGLSIDKLYVAETVLKAVKEAVVEAFSFDERAFGQAVTASEVVAVMQAVEGVVYVDLNKLNGEDAFVQPRLPASIARPQNSGIEPAQLLVVDPDKITLSEIAS